jgi:hypothetical protein
MAESSATKFALIKKDIVEIYKDIANFVNKNDFISEIKRIDARINPIEKIVYGIVGAILLAFLSSMIAIVMGKI